LTCGLAAAGSLVNTELENDRWENVREGDEEVRREVLETVDRREGNDRRIMDWLAADETDVTVWRSSERRL
jgi:hypothetical protein